MKINILSKIALICLLLISISCSKENSDEIEEVNQSETSYTISYDDSIKSNIANKGGNAPAVMKYLKITYTTEQGRDIVRNMISNIITDSSIEITNDLQLTDLWIFNQEYQSAVDALFETSSGIGCIPCYHIVDLPVGHNNPDYIVVEEVCYVPGITEDIKESKRNEYTDSLMHIISSSFFDCETWVMRSCCLTPEECPDGGVPPGTQQIIESVTNIQ